MITVFLHEFKALCRNIIAISCIAIFAMASAILMIVNNFNMGYAGIEAILSSMTLVAAVLIPAVSASIITKDKKSRMSEFFASLPLTKAKILLGKFFALVAFFAIPTLIIGIYPIILLFYSDSGVGPAYLAIFMFSLVEVFFIAFGVMMSALFKKIWKAITVSYVVLGLLFVLGVVAIVLPDSALAGLICFLIVAIFVGALAWIISKRIALFFIPSGLIALVSSILFFVFPSMLENSVEKFLKFLSPFRHFDPVVFGLFDISAIVFYLSFAALFLGIALLAMKKSGKGQTKPRKPAKFLKALICLAVISATFLGNMTVCAAPKRFVNFDVTSNRFYKVSDDSKEYLKALDEDITVYLIDAMGTEEKLSSYIRRYCELSNRITVKYIDSRKDTELLEKFQIELPVAMYSMVVESSRRWKFVSSEEYFVYEHPQLGYMTPLSYLNRLKLYGDALEQASGDSYSNYQAMYQSLIYDTQYCFKAEEAIGRAIEYVTADYIPKIYFVSGHGEKKTDASPLDITKITDIPVDAALLFINAPDKDYTAAETSMILRYTQAGGRLIFLSSTENSAEKMPNLANLMACYGLSTNSEAILQAGKTDVSASINTSVFTGGVSSVNMKNVSEITVAEGVNSIPLIAVAAEVPVDTSNSQATEGGTEAQTGETDSTDKSETGKVQTKIENKNVAMLVYQNNVPSIIWVTGADSFNVNTQGLDEAQQNKYLQLMNLLQGMVNAIRKNFEYEIVYPVPQPYTEAILTADKGDATFVGVVTIAIIPCIILFAGVLNIYIRKKRSKTIEVE